MFIKSFFNFLSKFHYDSIFGTIINRFITQTVCEKDMTVYGKGNQKRAFLNISDTINCVSIACENPPKSGEFRVFNQFTEFCTLNEIATRIQNYADNNKIKSKISHIENPRIESEDHYYNPVFQGLVDIGVKPHYLTDEIINNIFKIVEYFKKNIRKDVMFRGIKWQ